MADRLNIKYCTLETAKSETTPTAQCTTQCADRVNARRTPESIRLVSEEMANRETTFYLIYCILSSCGLRVSECLSIMAHHISNDGHFKVKGKKGSNDAVYYCSEAADYLMSCKKKTMHPWGGVSRFQVYRVFKKYGISYQFETNERASVTHLPRHEYALQVKSIEGEDNLVSQSLRHKNTQNRRFYEKEQ